MADTAEFSNYPITFLESHVLIVPVETDKAVITPGVHDFELRSVTGNARWLYVAGSSATEKIRAYYLPWQSQKAMTMTLGGEKDVKYFFTSHLTNCRFKVIEGENSTSPRVGHTAGDIPSPLKRDEAERREDFVPGPGQRARSLSISDSKEVIAKTTPYMKIEGRTKLHDYGGQSRGRESSAFVFGQRQEDDTWRFYAQITKGVCAHDRMIDLGEDLNVLKWFDNAVYQI